MTGNLQDIKKPWLNLIRRLQSEAGSTKRHGGVSVLKVLVVVNGDGVPVAWTSPVRVGLEPIKNHDLLINLVQGMDGETMEQLLAALGG